MPESGSIAGLGLEAVLGFGGGSCFREGIGLVLRPKRLQALNPQQVSGLLEGLSLRVQGTAPVRIRLWLPRPHMSISQWSSRPLEFSQAAAASPGK